MFKKKANEVVSFLQEEFSDVDYDLNPDKPRKGAFNISVKVGNDTHEVWDGRSKGPPRKDKWPDLDKLVKDLKKLA